MLDDIDIHLIRILQEHGRIANNELATRVGLSPSGCLRRVQNLESEGVIVGYHASLAPKKVDLGLQTFVRVDLAKNDRDNLDRFTNEVSSWKEVIGCYSVTGDSDYLLHVITKDLDSYNDFMMTRLLRNPVVASVNTSVVLTVEKAPRMLPLDHLFGLEDIQDP